MKPILKSLTYGLAPVSMVSPVVAHSTSQNKNENDKPRRDVIESEKINEIIRNYLLENTNLNKLVDSTQVIGLIREYLKQAGIKPNTVTISQVHKIIKHYVNDLSRNIDKERIAKIVNDYLTKSDEIKKMIEDKLSQSDQSVKEIDEDGIEKIILSIDRKEVAKLYERYKEKWTNFQNKDKLNLIKGLTLPEEFAHWKNWFYLKPKVLKQLEDFSESKAHLASEIVHLDNLLEQLNQYNEVIAQVNNAYLDASFEKYDELWEQVINKEIKKVDPDVPLTKEEKEQSWTKLQAIDQSRRLTKEQVVSTDQITSMINEMEHYLANIDKFNQLEERNSKGAANRAYHALMRYVQNPIIINDGYGYYKKLTFDEGVTDFLEEDRGKPWTIFPKKPKVVSRDEILKYESIAKIDEEIKKWVDYAKAINEYNIAVASANLAHKLKSIENKKIVEMNQMYSLDWLYSSFVRKIPNDAFKHKSFNFDSGGLRLPKTNLETIGERAFLGAEFANMQLEFPESLKVFEESAFESAKFIVTKVHFESGSKNVLFKRNSFKGAELRPGFKIPEGSIIEEGAFEGVLNWYDKRYWFDSKTKEYHKTDNPQAGWEIVVKH